MGEAPDLRSSRSGPRDAAVRWKPLFDCLGAIADPRFWVRNYSISYAWDAQLNRALDRHPVIPRDLGGEVFDVEIGDLTVWVKNWPYAFGYHEGWRVLPLRSTAIRLRKALDAAMLDRSEPASHTKGERP
jgi:hypothetical protein